MFRHVTADNLHKQERFYFQAMLVRKRRGKTYKVGQKQLLLEKVDWSLYHRQ